MFVLTYTPLKTDSVSFFWKLDSNLTVLIQKSCLIDPGGHAVWGLCLRALACSLAWFAGSKTAGDIIRFLWMLCVVQAEASAGGRVLILPCVFCVCVFCVCVFCVCVCVFCVCVYVCFFVCVCVLCVCMCVFCVMCNSNFLHLQWVSRRDPTKKDWKKKIIFMFNVVNMESAARQFLGAFTTSRSAY